MRDNECEVSLGGRKTLRFNTRAIKIIERKTGKSFLSGGLDPEKLGFEWITIAAFAGLAHYEDRNITEDKVDEWFDGLSHAMTLGPDEDNLQSISTKIGTALAAGIPGVPRAEKQAAENPPPPVH